ncbi:hypothetical protein ES332_A02G078100v1 [Gossypium tomentosum]|uniref:Uncharacterized protein n=1 Tax=Gossypium tomentosum TaxID=34277 RepID=A0A5D2REC0_GOSTO|nr:hypothetical protein ES332_A02G078100v1 [Gossypium tomentosum]
MEQLFLIFVSDLCYQQWHQQFNIQYHPFSFLFFSSTIFVSYDEKLFLFLSLFLHINMPADMMEACNLNQRV